VTGWSLAALEADVDRFHLGPVDLEVEPGRSVAVLGRSGAGKTTLLRAIAGFLPTRRGQVRRGATDVTDWAPERRGLGYVPQGLGLFPNRSVARNVAYPLEIRERNDARARTRALLERFSLTPLAARRPAQLSGGEAQRVALARALAADPELILWDEPWQGLDVEARHALSQVLHELREEERVPVIVVTHDPALAFSIADRFLILRDGAVRFASDATTLLDRPPDAFAARFVGFENVFDRDALERAGDSSLATWLGSVAGPEGVAFSAPTVGPGGGAGRWSGRVRSARPTPRGVVIESLSDGLPIVLRLDRVAGTPIPGVGSSLRYDLDPREIHALGGRGPVPEAGA